jgi:hypothetical protein
MRTYKKYYSTRKAAVISAKKQGISADKVHRVKSGDMEGFYVIVV